MKRIPVSSSDINSIGYDNFTHILEIEFHDGSVYQYYNVPESVYNGLMSASSHGKYFHQYIKDQYDYSKI